MTDAIPYATVRFILTVAALTALAACDFRPPSHPETINLKALDSASVLLEQATHAEIASGSDAAGLEHIIIDVPPSLRNAAHVELRTKLRKQYTFSLGEYQRASALWIEGLDKFAAGYNVSTTDLRNAFIAASPSVPPMPANCDDRCTAVMVSRFGSLMARHWHLVRSQLQSLEKVQAARRDDYDAARAQEHCGEVPSACGGSV